jgi:hypothetical protein
MSLRQIRAGKAGRRALNTSPMEAPPEEDFSGEGLYDSRPGCQKILQFPVKRED